MNLVTNKLSKIYGDQEALNSVSLKVESVGCMALIGPSGGGKSTFLRIVGGLERATSGSIELEGAPLPTEKQALLQHRRANGFLFQSFNLFPHMSALKNITLPLEKVHGYDSEKAVDVANEALKRFGMGPHTAKYPAQLSGGQQQRIALARAVSHKPRLLLLDEPTSALDPEMTAEVLELVQDLAEAGQNIILSTHEMGFAKAVADKVVFLAEGTVKASGSASDVFDNPEDPTVSRFLSKVMKFN